MRIVFAGGVIFSAELLAHLVNSRFELVGVIAPNLAMNADYADLSSVATKYDIPFIATNDINALDTHCWLSLMNCDLLICVGWSRLLSKPTLGIPRLGVIGYHPTLLPMHRGRHPIIWPIALGLTETGSTFFKMDEGIDTGEILSQRRVPISIDDNAQTMYQKLLNVANKQIIEILNKVVATGQIKGVMQDVKVGSSWRKRSFSDGVIDWRMAAVDIHNLVRALHPPYPCASFVYSGKEIKVIKTQVLFQDKSEKVEPGKVLHRQTNLVITIQTGNGLISLLDYHPKLRIEIGEYL